jgi:hypothetical protein
MQHKFCDVLVISDGSYGAEFARDLLDLGDARVLVLQLPEKARSGALALEIGSRRVASPGAFWTAASITVLGGSANARVALGTPVEFHKVPGGVHIRLSDERTSPVRSTLAQLGFQQHAARIVSFDPGTGPELHRLTIEDSNGALTSIGASWIVDASAGSWLLRELKQEVKTRSGATCVAFSVEGHGSTQGHREHAAFTSDGASGECFLGANYSVMTCPSAFGTLVEVTSLASGRDELPMDSRELVSWLRANAPLVAEQIGSRAIRDVRLWLETERLVPQIIGVPQQRFPRLDCSRWAVVLDAGHYLDSRFGFGLELARMTSRIVAILIHRDLAGALERGLAVFWNDWLYEYCQYAIGRFRSWYGLRSSEMARRKLGWERFAAAEQLWGLQADCVCRDRVAGDSSQLVPLLRLARHVHEWQRLASDMATTLRAVPTLDDGDAIGRSTAAWLESLSVTWPAGANLIELEPGVERHTTALQRVALSAKQAAISAHMAT